MELQRSLVVRPLLALAVVVGALGLAAPEARAVPDRGGPPRHVVEPWDPATPPAQPPAVELTAACVRPARGGFEAVFGYRNPGDHSILVPLGPDGPEPLTNVIERTRVRGKPPRPSTTVEELGPQVTLFKPGDHPYEFAVSFRPNEQVAWEVRVPSVGGGLDYFWRVTVRPPSVRCGRDVPDHFAVVQDASLSAGPVNIGRNALGHVVTYDLEHGLFQHRVACSAGGELAGLRFVVGWSPNTNLEPIEPDYLVELDAFGQSFSMEMSTTTVRSVVDVLEPMQWLGPIADVTATCRFRRDTVESDVFWAEQIGTGSVQHIIVDGALVDVYPLYVAPGGSRLR